MTRGRLALRRAAAGTCALHSLRFEPNPRHRELDADAAAIPGITKANTGLEGSSGIFWARPTCPKQLNENSFSWHATFPPGTFVPPHIHPTQDEFIYMLEGRFDLVLDGKEFVATAGDLIRLPMNIPHGIFNKTDQTVKCFFWVTPTRKLYDLFWAIHSMKEQNPPEVVALSARHEVIFLPPPAVIAVVPARWDRELDLSDVSAGTSPARAYARASVQATLRRLVDLLAGESGLRGIAAHDRLALLERQHVVDVGRSRRARAPRPRRSRLPARRAVASARSAPSSAAARCS